LHSWTVVVDFHGRQCIARGMGGRKHISYKTLYAAELSRRCDVPYDHLKLMGIDNFLSLYQTHHNKLHCFGTEDRDDFWNLEAMLIAAHREQTKKDRKTIAKSKRIRRQGHHLILSPEARQELREGNPIDVLREVFQEGMFEGRQYSNAAWIEEANRPGGAVRWARKLQSRGFDKTRRRKIDGTVVKVR
jgi:hypothetical protein